MLSYTHPAYSAFMDGQLLRCRTVSGVSFSVPAAFCVNDVIYAPALISSDENSAVFAAGNASMRFHFAHDCITVECTLRADADMPVFVSKVFRSESAAIALDGFDRAFTSQPRNNGWNNMDYFNHLPDISISGYFSPPTFNFSIGSRAGWVSFGLLDIPDSTICRMDADYSFLVESCGGNKVIRAGETYRLPRVLITFPQDEMQAVSLFRQKLIDFGLYTPRKPAYTDLPAWWRHPFVCTYGDQMIEHRVGQRIDEAWVSDFVARAENEWGLSHFNLIIDDSWQLPHAFEPIVDTARFPDLRGFIDRLHARGHHVILWNTPMFDNLANGFRTRAQRHGMLTDYRYADHAPEGYFALYYPDCYPIDYTSDNAQDFLREICEILFGDGEGQLNADGVKLDFIACLRDPSKTTSYAHPERGVGARELLRFYELFYAQAKRVKPDVIIDCTAGDPRFEHCLDFNRMHDSHCGTIEKEIRAELSARACPDLPIDSDGALMFSHWIKKHYIAAAVYGVPSMYYIKEFHDFATDEDTGECLYDHSEKGHLTPDEKQQIGRLLSLCAVRPDGHPRMRSYGNWLLREGETINGYCQNGETLVFFPTKKNPTGYLFTWQDETLILPLYAHRFSALSPADSCRHLLVDYARDRVIVHLKPGVVYTFRDEDDGTSIERIFTHARPAESAESEVNYVNA